MRVETPEIAWHNTTPVYSCDIQPKLKEDSHDSWSRLATCGRDNFIRIWKVSNSASKPQFLSCLRRHDKPVNVVRFVPTGDDLLASGGDDGLVIFWKRDTSSSSATSSSRTLFGQDADEDEECCELWQVSRILRRHLEDVYDLSWSVDGNCLISGSVDHSAIEWNLKSGQQLLLKDHKQYVQGVAWDPLDEYVLSMGSDRSCRVYRVGSRNCSFNIVRHDKQRLFQDDSWKSFFRRLSFSPDGSLIVCPAGCHGVDGHAAYVFTRQSIPSPVLALPTESRPVVSVRFCPSPFCLPPGATPLFALPYMWVFCLVLEDSVLIYNTNSKFPIAYIGAIHYQALNDAAWSADGRILSICSTDGYCSIVQFDNNELGQQYISDKPTLVPGIPTDIAKDNNAENRIQTKKEESSKVTTQKSTVVGDKTISANPGNDAKISQKKSVKLKKESNKSKIEKSSTREEMECTPLERTDESKSIVRYTDDVMMDTSEPSRMTEVTHDTKEKESKPIESVLSGSPLPSKKKRRVTFVTIDSPCKDNDDIEMSDAAPTKSKVDEHENKGKRDDDGTPRKRRVPITTISSEPLGEQSSSPLQAMKRRVAFTTLTSEVSPDDVTDNLSNMSAPEFNLTLEDSMIEKKNSCESDP